MPDEDQESRIRAALRIDDDLRFEEAVARFYEHLEKTLRFPFEVTGIEDFAWEEIYLFGPGDKREYERLKRSRPSFRDRFDLLEIDTELKSEWMLARDDIGALVRRRSDDRKFCLGLAELSATDTKSDNYRILDDYAVWFVNGR